jgi:hypothetical protein
MSDPAAGTLAAAPAWLASLESLYVARAIRQSLYLFPTLEATHVIALGVLFGSILVVDLRILGIASTERRFSKVSGDLLKWTWGAFLLAVLTGSLMFTTNAQVYWSNTSFRIKMLLILLAGINMLVFHLSCGRSRHWDEAKRAPSIGVVCGAASIALWVLIIGAGRVIGFTTTGAAAKQAAPAASDIDFDALLEGGAAPAAGSAPARPQSAAPAGPGGLTKGSADQGPH